MRMPPIECACGSLTLPFCRVILGLGQGGGTGHASCTVGEDDCYGQHGGDQ